MAETLVQIVSLSDFDQFVHEQEHLLSLEGFDFGPLLKKLETEEKCLRSKDDVIALLLTQGDRWCQWVEGLPENLLSEQVLKTVIAALSKRGDQSAIFNTTFW